MYTGNSSPQPGQTNDFKLRQTASLLGTQQKEFRGAHTSRSYLVPSRFHEIKISCAPKTYNKIKSHLTSCCLTGTTPFWSRPNPSGARHKCGFIHVAISTTKAYATSTLTSMGSLYNHQTGLHSTHKRHQAILLTDFGHYPSSNASVVS